MDTCLNLDPESTKQAECDHRPRDLAVLVHWVHHPKVGDFLIDTGFDGSFAKHPPYGNYTEAMRLFNWINGITNRQEPGLWQIEFFNHRFFTRAGDGASRAERGRLW